MEETTESNPVLPDAIAGDKLLMIVHGQTIAGVDLSQLKPDSVEITDTGGSRSIRLTLGRLHESAQQMCIRDRP